MMTTNYTGILGGQPVPAGYKGYLSGLVVSLALALLTIAVKGIPPSSSCGRWPNWPVR